MGVLVAVGALAVSCTAGGTPATAPSLPAASSTVTTVTASSPTTSMVASPSSSTVDRLAEVQAIFEDLERRRLQALYDGDRDAFAELFANDAYLEEYLANWDELASFIMSPPDGVVIESREILNDSPDCIAVLLFTDYRASIPDGTPGEVEAVVERRTDGTWGLSWQGSGWRCDGPHPLSQ